MQIDALHATAVSSEGISRTQNNTPPGINNYRSDQGEARQSTDLDEYPDYLNLESEQLYYVVHKPKATASAYVLLAGHFASERPHAYLSWVRWARYLASQGFHVLRFDYRGVGESTGTFEDQGFHTWTADIREFSRMLRKQACGAPFILHGVGIGALLAPRVFDEGLGDALLGWSPPESGRHMLYETLRLRLATDFALKPDEKRRTRDEYVSDLESGKLVEVEGFLWNERLWRESADFPKAGYEVLANSVPDCRPRLAMELDRRAGDLLPLSSRLTAPKAPGQPARFGPETSTLNLDLSFLFEPSCAWMKDAIKTSGVVSV